MYIDFHLIKELNPVVGENLLVSQMENRGTILSGYSVYSLSDYYAILEKQKEVLSI